ncbi:hypothetical protein D3C87_176330 [compost metagenome]
MKKILALDIKTKMLLIAFLLLGLMSLITSLLGVKKEEPTSFAPEPPSVDTFIPRGHVLVPIELSNAESLSSLVGDVGGVVDLYLATNEKQKTGIKVGTKLKLLRAPLNPQQYAVLVRDHESSRILSFSGPFIAVVQNPQARGQEVAGPKPQQVQIDYQN